MTQTRSDASDDEQPQQRRWIVAALVVALALRVWEALSSSLWLDELHTLSHASQPTLAALLERVELERVHVPLFFAAVQRFGAWDEGEALRWIPILASLLTLVPLCALAREALGNSRAVALAAWLFACLPHLVHWGAELRPYSSWGLFSAGAAWAAFSERGSLKLRTVLFFVCALAGIWTHRLMAVSVFSVGVARLFVRSPQMVPLPRLIVAGVLAFAPMGLWVVRFAQRATADRLEYQEQIGGFRLRSALLAEFAALPLRLFAPFMGALGGVWATLVKVGGALVALGAWGAVLRQPSFVRAGFARPTLRALAIYAATHYVVVVALAWWTWDRLPLQYFTPIVWLLPLFTAAVIDFQRPGGARATVALLCAGALSMGVGQAGGRALEDMRGAVAQARELGAALERPIYSAVLSQPSVFEHVLPYRAYAPELDFREPNALPQPADPDFARPLVVLRRGQIPLSDESFQPVLAGREIVDERRVDSYLTLFVLRPDAR